MEFLPLLYLIIHSVQAVMLDIPQEARMLRGKTIYTLYTVERTWKNAREMCRLTGGYLMNVDTDNKYRILEDIKSDPDSDFKTPWIGLYWSSRVDMHNDGPGCPPPSPNYRWKSDGDAEYKDGEVCYKENGGLEKKTCAEDNTFICETYREDGQGCSMNSSSSIVFDVEKIDQSSITSCNELCYTKDGCFLSGSVNSTYCGMLLTPDVANFTVGVKNCDYEIKVNTTTHTLVEDKTDPTTDCIAVPDNQNGTTYGCPTIVEQLIETVSVTIIQTDVVTDYITQTFEKTIVETVSHAVPTTIFSTEQLTITTTEQLVTTQATTIAPSYIVTTVIQPTTVTLDGTTIVSTVTDTASHIVPTTILSTQLITVTTTKLLLETQAAEFITITPSQVVSTLIQPTTVTFTPAAVLVTVTETPSPIVCPIPTTLTFSVPCTDKLVSSVGPSACIEQSSVKQTSFGALGFLDPEGVLRTNICHDVIVVTSDESATERAVSSIVRALTVEKSNISAISNKKISAPDYRSSSTAIGYFGIILFSLPFAFLLALDGISLLEKIQRMGLIQRSYGQK